MRWVFSLLILCAFSAPNLPRYDTRYYVIYTDLDKDQVQEASVHVTKMAEIYAERTRGFSGAIRGKLPFVLYTRADDYYRAGGEKGSSGVFTGQLLMAIAGDRLSSRTWHVVQHEGFHQFAAAVIGGDMPVWIDEGLAEYFGEGLFTGDDMFTGIIPEWRRERVVARMKADGFEPLDRFMRKTIHEWNGELSPINYDQAWSMVQFLAHGDDGKYQPMLVQFMNLLSKRKGSTEAWNQAFGDTPGFERRWREYWLNLPKNPTENIYRKATVSTLTSFVGRAFSCGQKFESIEDFAKAASEKKLKISPNDFLPRTLLAGAMEDVGARIKEGDQFKIEQGAEKKSQPQVVLIRADGLRIIGSFTLRDGRVTNVLIDGAAR